MHSKANGFLASMWTLKSPPIDGLLWRFMHATLLAVLSVWSSVCLGQPVGRTEITGLSDDWNLLASYETAGLVLDQGQKVVPMEGKLFVNKSRDMLLVVEGTSGANGRGVAWVSVVCQPKRANVYTNDYGSNQVRRERQCLVVNTKFSSRRYMRETFPQAADVLEKNNLSFDEGTLFRITSGVKSGTYVKVLLIKKTSFEMDPNAPRDAETGVPQSLVSLGESLHALLSTATSTVSGKFALQILNSIK